MFKDGAEQVLPRFKNFVANKAGWFFILSVNIFLIFMVYLAFSKFGHLGRANAKPEFKTLSWFAMLLVRDGIGLLFWSISEPVIIF
jgi:choline/glycine/proline betaine transport protein